jgi:uncharacterized protein YndB with AHSA1/START domain
MAEPDPFGTGGFTTRRVFAAARERVWREWTEPESFADWFGGVECEGATLDRLDGRPRRWGLASDDVLRPRAPRDPVEG